MVRRKKGGSVPGQLSLFDFVEEIQQEQEKSTEINPGSLNISLQLRNTLSEGLKYSSLSRFEVACRMSELVGVEITKSQLDSWTAESKEHHRFPAEYLPAFCHVTGFKQPLKMMAKLVQCYLLESEEALLAELGKIDQVRKDLSRREKTVRDLIGRMKADM
ncbi:conserved hypothetical protein [Desulfofarcimen acetoxidans DSM 771]|uniref:Uncharacterized protein n=1 Tax=Desulfofarcimen acetoxidans (strain ATCC 49208 / DSM 771 / KCTC 5769 / VKM B-1644 / 5575) TaxID=485916 RepID=C8VZD5_DESAS|nr:hypothetical protein [Desulfofarcimen acetoxidans]ACV64880.1 conserved hypothetical protein [Desulfofarcimen acetoxidans DSM 771]